MVAARCLLIGGPLDGHSVMYGHPLPPILCVASRDPIRWHDYRQTEHGNIYRHSANCKCVRWEQPPVQLDDDGPDTTVLCW